MGIKGESILAGFIDLAKQNPLDMHQAHRGVVDRILTAILGLAARKDRKQWTLREQDIEQVGKLQSEVS